MPSQPTINRELNSTFFNLKDRFFVIPAYQRDYKWNHKEIETLLEDIYFSFRHDKSTFWLGVILLKNKNIDTLNIIDGQQRILTMFWIIKIFWPEFKIKGLESESAESGIYFKNKNSILVEINDFCQIGKISFRKQFQDLHNSINKFKKDKFDKATLTEDEYNLDSFISYLKNKVTCSILMAQEDNYEYFENINSKLVRLTLTEKCLAFLINDWSGKRIITENKEIFSWFVSDKLHPHFGRFKSEDILEAFVAIYANFSKKHSKDVFSNFKLLFKKKQMYETFLKFLTEIKNLIQTKEKTFSITYLNQICFSDYWAIYVKSITNNNLAFCETFLDTIWKIDLIRGLGSLGRISVKSSVKSFLGKELSEVNYYNLLTNLIKKVDQNNQIIFESDSNDIEKRPYNSARIKALFFLLYCKSDDTKTRFYQFVNEFDKMDIDHIQPQKSSFNFTSDQLNKLTNLQLLDSITNSQLQDDDIDEKIDSLDKNGNNVRNMQKLVNEIVKDWRSVASINNLSSKEKIEKFWQIRKNSLDKRLESIRQHLIINVGSSSQLSFSSFPKEMVTNWLKEEFNWVKQPQYSGIFRKEGHFVIFKFFALVGKPEKFSDHRISLPEKTIDFLIQNDVKTVFIFAFHPVEKQFFRYEVSTDYLYKRVNETKKKILHFTTRHFDKDNDDCREMNQRWTETNSSDDKS